MLVSNQKIQIKNHSLLRITKGIRREQILGVALDTGKDFHMAILFDFNGKILHKPFPIINMRAGYEKLQKYMTRVSKKIRAKRIIIGIEIVHIYAENFTRQLKTNYNNVFFINPIATASNRNQKLLLGLKNDAIDSASIADLLIRGECYAYNLREGMYLELKEKTYWRERKMNMLTKIKNQIINGMDRIYPGMNTEFEGNDPLFTHRLTGDIPKLLLDLEMTPQQITAMPAQDLSKFCLDRGYFVKIKKAKLIIAYFQRLLFVPEHIASIYLEMLKRDVRFLKHFEKEIEEIEQRMLEITARTPAKILFKQIKGLSEIMVACYIGCIGNISNFSSAGKIYSMAGLSPKMSQSGSSLGKGLGIKRSGNKILRSTLYKMASRVSLHEPYFRDYYERIKVGRSRKEALIAVANKLNRVMFVMMKKQKPFKPPATGNPKRILGR